MKKVGQNETKETKDQQQKIQMVSKTHQTIHFARSQKSHQKYIVSKSLYALEIFPYN